MNASITGLHHRSKFFTFRDILTTIFVNLYLKGDCIFLPLLWIHELERLWSEYASQWMCLSYSLFLCYVSIEVVLTKNLQNGMVAVFLTTTWTTFFPSSRILHIRETLRLRYTVSPFPKHLFVFLCEWLSMLCSGTDVLCTKLSKQTLQWIVEHTESCILFVEEVC